MIFFNIGFIKALSPYQVFFDGFETSSAAGDDTFNVSIWSEEDGTDANEAQVVSGGSQINGTYAAMLDEGDEAEVAITTISGLVDISGKSDCNLSFNYKTTASNPLETGDILYVDAYNGATWNYGVFSLIGVTNITTSAKQAILNLSAYSSSNLTQIRFDWEAQQDGENIVIDDVNVTCLASDAPVISNITASHSVIKGGDTITIYANTTNHGVNDSENDTLYLYCDSTTTPTSSNTDCTGGVTSDSARPYVLTCTFSTLTTNTNYTEYCRVYDGSSYSSAVNVSYTTDSNAPSTSVTSVAGDAIASYFDNLNDGVTNIVISGETSMVCRWSSSDVAYSSMSNACSISGTSANCSVTDALTQGLLTKYVACADNLTNEQNSSTNLDVSFYLDYTAPTTTDDSTNNFQAPNYTITITENDNIDSDPLTYYCTDSSAGCNPITLIDNLGTITYSSLNRGANYLRYYSIDDAGNSQTIVNKTININKLPILTSAVDNATTIKGGWYVNVSTNSYDPDSGQEITLFVCNSSGASASGCTNGHYCNSTGTGNLTCQFASQSDSTTHNWYAYIFDELNENATNNSISGSYITDSDAPSITLVNPVNASTIPQNSVTISISVNEALDRAFYSLNNGENVSMSNSTLYAYSNTNNSIANGNYNLSIWVNDSYGNIANLSGNYFIIDSSANDTSSPIITIWSPSNNSYDIDGNITINITSDENISWAGYSNNSNPIVNLSNVSTTNWNGSINLGEGQHNITFYANDSSSNKNQGNKSIIIYVDLTNPSVNNFSCSDVNDSQDVVCNGNFSDSIGLSYAIISYNATGNWINSSQISLSGITSNLSYTISAGNTTPGQFASYVYLYDLSGRNNLTVFDTVSITDDSYPGIYNITYFPNTTDALDPGVTLNVNASILENYNISNVTLMYKNSSGISWSSIAMSNLSSVIANTSVKYNASIVLGNETWYFKINASDAAGNTNISSNYTLAVDNESSFFNSTTIEDIKSITSSQASNNNSLGYLFINNTGDNQLNFTITIGSQDIGNRIDINGSGNLTSYSILPGSNVNLSFYVNATSLSAGLYNYNITLNNSLGNISIYQKRVYMQTSPEPYLIAIIEIYSSNVTRGQSNIAFISNVKNLGTKEATGVSLNWSLPSEFTINSGNLSRSLGNIPIGANSTNSITLSVSSSTSQSSVTINTTANSTEGANSSDSRTITISDPLVIIQTITTGGGAAGSGGGGGGGESSKLVYNKIVELVRGKEDKFIIEIYNPFSNSSLNNIIVNFTGLLSKYIKTQPIIVPYIGPKEKINLTVNLSIPSYKGSYEEQELKAYISGKSNEKNYDETQKVLLIIQEISREDTIINLEIAQEVLKKMSENNFNTKEVQELIKRAQERLEKRRNKESFNFSQQIIEINKTAFDADDLIARVNEALENPRKMSLISGNIIKDYGVIGTGKVIFNSESTREILDMASAAFERGDYKTSLDRAKQAQVMLVLERKGNFALFLYLYWYFVIGGFILMSIFGIIGYKNYQKTSISRRIIDMDKEEDNISFLIKNNQKNYFTGKISQPDYYNIMVKHQRKIAEIKKSRTNLRNKRIKLLQGRELIKELDNERMQVEILIKRLQTDFYVDKKISESEYKSQFQILNERLAEIEEERSTIHIIEKTSFNKRGDISERENKFLKISKGITNFINYLFSHIKAIKYNHSLKNEKKVKEKIKEMLEKKK